MGVYRIDLDGSVHLIAVNATKPNGITISPDQKKLYVANNDHPGAGVYGSLPEGYSGPLPKRNGSVLEYALLPDGNVKFNRQLIEFGSQEGPDGIKVDTEGNLYITLGNKIVIYSVQGVKLTEVKIPVEDGEFAANLCFGRGEYSKTLFITATRTLYMIETKKQGFHIPFK